MDVGLLIEGQEGFSWQRWVEIVRWAEDAGFESLWRSDHYGPLGEGEVADAFETFVCLTHVAGATSRIRFGPLVCPMTFRHPAMLARTAAAIDAVSGGRFALGLGTGWHAGEHRMFGIDLPEPRRRVLALDEGAAVVRRLLSGERVSFDGEVFRLEAARIHPASAVPLLIGGVGERRTLRVVARHADEWNVPGLPVPTYRRKVAVLEKYCAQEGRDPTQIRRSVAFAQAIAATDAEVRRITDAMLARTPAQFRPGSHPDAPLWLVGTPDRIVEQLNLISAEGVDRVMLQYLQPPTRAELDLIAERILPNV